MSTHRLSGKVAVVSGASKGIGATIARHLAAAGAAVVVCDSSSKPSAETIVAGIVAAGGRAIAIHANASQPDEIAPAVVYLASEDSSWATGETHYLSDGLK